MNKRFYHIASMSLFLVALFVMTDSFVAKIAFVPSSSMSPTIHKNSIISINLNSHNFKRGDIVVFSHEGQNVVKRIIALKGDTVETRDGYVYVNGKKSDDFKVDYFLYPLKVTGDYFVLGDNRNNSYDSHLFGDISGDQIIGKVF